MIHVIKISSLASRGMYLSTCGCLGVSNLIPDEPIWKKHTESELPPRTKVSLDLAKRLERLSLVNFENTNAVERLESAIRFADQIQLVDTKGVEPMVTVLENIELPMRGDKVVDTDSSIVSLAKESFEGYYISPAGNITYDGDDIPDAANNVK